MDPGSPSRAAPIVRSFLTRSDSGTPNDSNVFPMPSLWGCVDELAIWNRALSNAKVNRLVGDGLQASGH